MSRNTEKEIARSIRFAPEVWRAIDRDAVRCNRSAVKHMEAIFIMMYEIGNPEIDAEKLQLVKAAVDAASVHRRPGVDVVKAVDSADEIPKKKKRS